MAKILVTGGTGFIGNHVVRLCLEQGDDVRVMVMAGEDRSPLQDLEVEIVEGNLLDPPSLRRAVAGCARLYHWRPCSRCGPKTRTCITRSMSMAPAT